MPPNPNVNAEFSHRLTQEQKTAAEEALRQGRQVDVKEAALSNILKDYDDPADALRDLAEGKASLEAEWNRLEAIRASGTALNPDQQQEYDRLARQYKGNEQLERSVPGAYSRADENRILDFQEKPLGELAVDISSLDARLRDAQRAVTAARRAPGGRASAEFQQAQGRVRRLENLLQNARRIQADRSRPTPDQIREGQQQIDQQRQQEEARTRAQRAELSGMDIRTLRGEIERTQENVVELQNLRTTRAGAGASAEELESIQSQIDRAEERVREANRALGDKLSTAAERIDEDIAKQNEEIFVQRATSAQLREEINTRQGAADNLRDTIEDLRDQIDLLPPGSPALRDLQSQLYDAMQQLQREEKVLKTYHDEVSKSNREFRNMDPSARADQLAKLGEEIDLWRYNIDDIQDRLYQGNHVTKEEMAAWSRSTVIELVEHGRANIDMGQLNRIITMRPELRHAIANGFANSQEGQNFLRENFPSGWERVMDFARRHPSWLVFLLALLLGGGAVVAATAGPAVGVAAGAAAAGVTGTGVSRRNW